MMTRSEVPPAGTVAVESSDGPLPEGRYRIATVAELTGVPIATLRAWERRYGIWEPERTASGYRLYGPDDVAQVSEMRRLCEDEGMAPAEAARVVAARRERASSSRSEAEEDRARVAPADAYAAASRHRGQPTVILAKTIKGFGMGASGESRNLAHQAKKMSAASAVAFRERFQLELDDRQRFVGNNLEAIVRAQTGAIAHNLVAGLELQRLADEFGLGFAFLPAATLDGRGEQLSSHGQLFPIARGDARSDVVAPYLIDQIELSPRE